MRLALVTAMLVVGAAAPTLALADDPGAPESPIRAAIGLRAGGSAVFGERGETDLGGGGGGHVLVGFTLPGDGLIAALVSFTAHWHTEVEGGPRDLASSTPSAGLAAAWRPTRDLVLQGTVAYAFGSLTTNGGGDTRASVDTAGLALGFGPLWRFYLGGPTWLELGPWLGWDALWVDTGDATNRVDQITLSLMLQTTFDVRL